MNEQEFIQALSLKGIILSKDQLDKFNKYYELLVETNKIHNLTSITEKNDVYLKHFYDSISVAFDFDFSNQSIADVGAGAGFPSIPLKIVYPSLKVTIIDSLNKRINFLNQLFKELDLDSCKAIASRAEDYAKEHRESFDVVTARAVARLNILDELCLPLVKKGGYFISLKGRDALNELEEAKKGIRILGGETKKECTFKLLNDDSRTNIFIEKIKNTPSAYPRNYSQIKKKPL